jgi:hypothetical protein
MFCEPVTGWNFEHSSNNENTANCPLRPNSTLNLPQADTVHPKGCRRNSQKHLALRQSLNIGEPEVESSLVAEPIRIAEESIQVTAVGTRRRMGDHGK